MENKGHFSKMTSRHLHGHKIPPGEGVYGSPHFSEVSL